MRTKTQAESGLGREPNAESHLGGGQEKAGSLAQHPSYTQRSRSGRVAGGLAQADLAPVPRIHHALHVTSHILLKTGRDHSALSKVVREDSCGHICPGQYPDSPPYYPRKQGQLRRTPAFPGSHKAAVSLCWGNPVAQLQGSHLPPEAWF